MPGRAGFRNRADCLTYILHGAPMESAMVVWTLEGALIWYPVSDKKSSRGSPKYFKSV